MGALLRMKREGMSIDVDVIPSRHSHAKFPVLFFLRINEMRHDHMVGTQVLLLIKLPFHPKYTYQPTIRPVMLLPENAQD